MAVARHQTRATPETGTADSRATNLTNAALRDSDAPITRNERPSLHMILASSTDAHRTCDTKVPPSYSRMNVYRLSELLLFGVLSISSYFFLGSGRRKSNDSAGRRQTGVFVSLTVSFSRRCRFGASWSVHLGEFTAPGGVPVCWNTFTIRTVSAAMASAA
jgi:hypothetical protein